MFMFKWIKLLLLVELGWDQIHYLNEPLWTFTIKKTRIENKSWFVIDNRQNLCEHGGLYPMISRKGKYILGNVYIFMKEIFIKIGNLRVCWHLIQVNKSLISLTMTYQVAIWDVICVSKKCGMTCEEKFTYWKNYIHLWWP